MPNVNATLSAVYADLHGPNVARANRAKNIAKVRLANKGTSEFWVTGANLDMWWDFILSTRLGVISLLHFDIHKEAITGKIDIQKV